MVEKPSPFLPQASFWLLLFLSLAPFVSAAMALLAGIALALTCGNPYAAKTKPTAGRMLALSVAGLGAGMNLAVISRVGLQGIGYTIIGISSTLAAGITLGRWLEVEGNTSLLISVGTAICGGSAIAAAASAVRAKSEEVSISLVTVFFLNAVALLVFPALGRLAGLDNRQFGLWSALSIHDTSSVVGAAMQYGRQALEIATTVKLARALWILPVTFILALARPRADAAAEAGKVKRPWFILGFLIMAAVVTAFPALRPAGEAVASGARRLLVATLFLIGASISRNALKSVGLRPFAQGFLLWAAVASATLSAIIAGWIR